MARQLRVEYEGAIYHVSCRMLGDAGSKLYKDDKDRERFLQRLQEKVEECGIRLYMFVLMSNHFHLVIETPMGNCSRFMQALLTAYTVYYNLRHKRHGHLFDGRFKAKLVDGDEYLLTLSRYVHLNPVKVSGIKKKDLAEKRACLRKYRWSSYPSYIGKGKRLSYVDYAPVLAQSGGKRLVRAGRYRAYVESGLADDDKEFMEIIKESPRSIGDIGFRTVIDELYEKLTKGHNKPEDVSFRRVLVNIDPEKVLDTLAAVFNVDRGEFMKQRKEKMLRPAAARCLIKYAGKDQRGAAEYLGIGTGAAVSLQLKKLRAVIADDKQLRRLIHQAESLLDEERRNT